MRNKISYLGCDMHKKYSLFVSMDDEGNFGPFIRKENDKNIIKEYLNTLPKGTPIAVESTGNWYWFIDELEQAGLHPMLAHPKKSKLMMGQINKTDKLDAKGLAILLKNGTLPTIWIPPGNLRDQRELLRWRMVLSQIKVKLKNRIQSVFAKYGIPLDGVSDLFGGKGQQLLYEKNFELPVETKKCVEQQLSLLSETEVKIKELENRLKLLIGENQQMKLIQTAPGIGTILSMVIIMELGDIKRFPRAEKLASYSGLVPRVHSSGGKTYYGKTRSDVNRYLKWAFVEAANSIVRHRKKWPNKHSVMLYERIRSKKGHAKAVVAVGRHLAEAIYWMLINNECYKEPKQKNVSSTPRQARYCSAS